MTYLKGAGRGFHIHTCFGISCKNVMLFPIKAFHRPHDALRIKSKFPSRYLKHPVWHLPLLEPLPSLVSTPLLRGTLHHSWPEISQLYESERLSLASRCRYSHLVEELGRFLGSPKWQVGGKMPQDSVELSIMCTRDQPQAPKWWIEIVTVHNGACEGDSSPYLSLARRS